MDDYNERANRQAAARARLEQKMKWIRNLAIVCIFLLIVAFASTYRIDTGEAGILTKWNGEKLPVTGVGYKLKLPFVEDIRTYSVVNNAIYFPADYKQLEAKWVADKQSGSICFDVNTPDNKVVDTCGMVIYRIVDIVQYAVMNVNPQEQLQAEVNSQFFKVLQANAYESDILIHNQQVVDTEILRQLNVGDLPKRYGVEFYQAELIRPTFTQEALMASAKKQATILLAEGEKEAAVLKANATRTIADAEDYKANKMANYQPWVLQYNSDIELIKVLGDKDRKDATIYVRTAGNGNRVTLPAPQQVSGPSITPTTSN